MKKRITIWIFVIMTILVSSCRTSRVSETQVRLLEYSMEKGDLPGSDWSVESKGWGANYGGESYSIVFIRDKHVFISQAVVIHSSSSQAQQAYKEWEKEWFDVTNLYLETPYVPLDEDDSYRFECFQLQATDPLMVCEYLQRHNQIINFVKINFDNRSANNLTFEEVKDILSILDEKLNKFTIDTNPMGDT